MERSKNYIGSVVADLREGIPLESRGSISWEQLLVSKERKDMKGVRDYQKQNEILELIGKNKSSWNIVREKKSHGRCLTLS